MNTPPAIGDWIKVLPAGARPEYPAGTLGKVVEVLHGACGPIVAVQFPCYPYATVDLYWRKVRLAGGAG